MTAQDKELWQYLLLTRQLEIACDACHILSIYFLPHSVIPTIPMVVEFSNAPPQKMGSRDLIDLLGPHEPALTVASVRKLFRWILTKFPGRAGLFVVLPEAERESRWPMALIEKMAGVS